MMLTILEMTDDFLTQDSEPFLEACRTEEPIFPPARQVLSGLSLSEKDAAPS